MDDDDSGGLLRLHLLVDLFVVFVVVVACCLFTIHHIHIHHRIINLAVKVETRLYISQFESIAIAHIQTESIGHSERLHDLVS